MQDIFYSSEGPALRRRDLLSALAGASVLISGPAVAQQPRPALVAVAASVQRALEELAPPWMRATGHRLNLIYGSSGNFVRQIQQGLKAELFLSADEEFALKLADTGLTQGRGVVYASGRVALLVAPGVVIELDPQLLGLKAAWPQVRKFAIANPELAPYGRSAREVLQSAGLWERAQGKLVIGDNVAQATQFVASGAAQAGLTALSLVSHDTAQQLGRHLALPASLHAPLHQRMVLLRQAGAAATAFYQYLQSPAARAVLRRHGFAVE
jgi:molybdate transport system substrate-binding protein